MFISMSWRFCTHSMTPQKEKRSPKWCSTQAVEGWSTTTWRSDERCILGLVMFGFWCVAVVLDRYLWCLTCWIIIYCICICYCLYIVLYTYFGGSPTEEADKTGIFLKILMFVGFLMNIRATWSRRGWLGLPRGSYVHRGTDEHKVNVTPGWLRDYMAYVDQPGGTDEHKGLRFVGSAWPTNVS
jgi:hypothetical protein